MIAAISAVTAAASAEAFSVTTRSAPPVPPAKVPINVPSRLTLAPETSIPVFGVPLSRIDSTSSALSAPALIETVNCPVSKSAESTSATRASPPCSIATAPLPSV